MIVRLVLIAVLLAVSIRLVLQARTSYRRGRVSLSDNMLPGAFIQREEQPQLFRQAMAVHMLLVVTAVGGAVLLAVKLVRFH